MQLLLEKGIDANQQNMMGNTPLHAAVLKDIVAFSCLIASNKSTNVNIPNKMGQTSLHLAVRNWKTVYNSAYTNVPFTVSDIVITLVKKGANLNAKGIFST